tara:strand:- start:8 stop:544 length:537 start_codon:yes stop_codon:yes gene_type:complete
MSNDTGVTNINELPSGDNVQLSIEEKSNSGQESINMNEIFKEIQNNGTKGNIPSRDIPINTNNVTLDESSKPNYLPKHEYYINENDFESSDEIIETKRKKDNRNSSIETLYEELQIPILLGVIYFLFQLPLFNNLLAKYLTFTFDTDGTLNLSGIVLKSILYAILYFILSKILVNISE